MDKRQVPINNVPNTRSRVPLEGVPIGYKLTEVGVIPADWDLKALGSSCEIITKGTTPTSIGRRFVNAGVKFLKAESISESGKALSSKVAFIDEDTHALLKRSQLVAGDVLISIAGVLGRVGLVMESDLPANTNQALAIVRLNKLSKVTHAFLFWCLRSPVIQKQIRDINVQAAQANISLQNVRDFQLPLPPSPEQRAIAGALSDVDELIGALGKLIAKKRAIKLAAMQQLLTGKTRLPGFSGEWKMKRIGEVAEIMNGATPSTYVADYWNGTIPWCTPTDITGTPGKYLLKTDRSITAEGLASCGTNLLPVGSLLLCSRATIGEVKIASTQVCTNQGFKSLVCKSGVDNEFLYYVLLTLKQQMIERAIGSTFLEIGKRDIASILLMIPDEPEQHAIATILSDMDAEIAVLERRRDKIKAIKQGMMQQLLTGRIRLVKEAS